MWERIDNDGDADMDGGPINLSTSSAMAEPPPKVNSGSAAVASTAATSADDVFSFNHCRMQQSQTTPRPPLLTTNDAGLSPTSTPVQRGNRPAAARRLNLSGPYSLPGVS